MFEDKYKSLSDNEDFVTFVQILRENNHMREQVMKILNMDLWDRKQTLRKMAMDMKARHMPPNIISIAESLSEDSVAQTLKTLLNEQQ